MAKSSGQKLKLLYIVKILTEESDEQHPISTKTLIDKLATYDVTAERKSIYDDIAKLQDFGYDIIQMDNRNGGGYYLASREFELAELKFLVDAVQSCRFITGKKSRELIKKLESMSGKHDAKHLQRQVYVAGRVKTENESIYYSIDALHRAIQENKQITFLYMEWNGKKELVPRKNGERYELSPWTLIWKDENYYLVAFDEAVGILKHFRVDKIADVEILEKSRAGAEQFENMDLATYANTTFGMYGGETEDVTLTFPEKLVGVVIDRFGKDISMRSVDGLMKARVKVVVSSQFFGWLSAVGKEIQILSPISVREQYIEWLKDLLKEYSRKKELIMQIIPATRMNHFGEGIFQVLNEKKREVEASGRKVYNFSVGTPDFPPAKHIMEAVAKACEKPENYKYALADLPELTDAVIKKYESRYGVYGLQPEEIMCVYGSQEGIAHIGLSLINEGDVVLIPDPGYPIFDVGPALAGAKLVTYGLREENDYLPDLEEIEKQWGEQAKLMIVSYPLNPICKVAPASFYERLIPWAKKNNIIIVHDNAYSDIIYDGHEGRSIFAFEGAKEVAVEFYSLSKSFNYTGARVSFVVGNKEIVQNFKKLRSQIDYGIFLPIQYGAIAALTGSDACVKEQCKEYEKRRNALCDGLTAIGWKFERSQGTMFAWAKIPDKFTDDVEFVMILLDKTGVLCTPGSSFGKMGAGHVRFALTMPVADIEEAIQQIAESKILE